MTKLNLGCGPHVMKGWLNYDIDGHNRNDVIPIDLSLGRLPHIDESVDFIFSEHFIEHITRPQALALMRECYRVMKPGAVMRLSTPDLASLIHEYGSKSLVRMPGVWEPDNRCAMVNEGMSLWGHQWVYDEEDLIVLLISAGFSSYKIRRCSRGYSEHPELCFLEVRPQHFEMYIEATKEHRLA